MYAYFVIYELGAGQQPAGLFVRQFSAGHALVWDHRARAWSYDPALVGRWLDDPDHDDRYGPVERAYADRVAPAITGGEALPDEDTLAWIFHWRGDPPQDDD